MRTLSISQKQASSPVRFYCSRVDVGQKWNHSAVIEVEKTDGEVPGLSEAVSVGAEYGSVIGYLKLLNEKLGDLRRILIDQTGVGEMFVEDAAKSGLKC